MKRPCLDCGVLADSHRCPPHLAIWERAQDAKRGTSTQRGYDAAWRRLRISILNRDAWMCQICGKHLVGPDATVDHRLAKVNGGTDEPGNLVAMCRRHNSSKGAR